MKKCNSDANLAQIKEAKNSYNDFIYKELYIIANYIKKNKEIIDTQNEKESIIKSYFDVITKDEFLRNKDINYQKYIINFVNKDKLKNKNKYIKIQNINLPNSPKDKRSSCSIYHFFFSSRHLSFI